MTNPGERRGSQAERLSMPLARNVVKELAVEHGAELIIGGLLASTEATDDEGHAA